MIKKKLIKPIKQLGVVNFNQGGNYTFLSPLKNDNDNISIDLSNYITQEQLTNKSLSPNFNTLSVVKTLTFGDAYGYNHIKLNGGVELVPTILGRTYEALSDFGIPTLGQVKKEIANSTPNIDLSNYYTKQEIDNNIRAIDNKASANLTNIETNKNDIKEINLKFNDYYTKQEIDTNKQDKLVVGAGLNLNGNNLTLTQAPITLEQVKQEIAKAELDDITLENVEQNLIAPINQQIQELQNKDTQLQQELNNKVDNSTLATLATKQELSTKQDKIINGDDCGINGNNQIYLLPKWKDKINTIETKQDKLHSNNNIIVNGDNTLSLEPSVFNGYATEQWVNDKFKNSLKCVLPANLIVGVDSWEQYEKTYAGVVDRNGQPIDLNSNTYVSNNLGPIGNKPRSYQNYTDFCIKVDNSPIDMSIYQKAIDTQKTLRDLSGAYDTPRIIDLGAKVKVAVFRFNFPSGNGTDCFNNFPPEIKAIQNVKWIENVEFNVEKQQNIHSCIDCYPIVSIYSKRFYIKRTSASSSYWDGTQARFKITYIEE